MKRITERISFGFLRPAPMLLENGCDEWRVIQDTRAAKFTARRSATRWFIFHALTSKLFNPTRPSVRLGRSGHRRLNGPLFAAAFAIFVTASRTWIIMEAGLPGKSLVQSESCGYK